MCPPQPFWVDIKIYSLYICHYRTFRKEIYEYDKPHKTKKLSFARNVQTIVLEYYILLISLILYISIIIYGFNGMAFLFDQH